MRPPLCDHPHLWQDAASAAGGEGGEGGEGAAEAEKQVAATRALYLARAVENGMKGVVKTLLKKGQRDGMQGGYLTAREENR